MRPKDWERGDDGGKIDLEYAEHGGGWAIPCRVEGRVGGGSAVDLRGESRDGADDGPRDDEMDGRRL